MAKNGSDEPVPEDIRSGPTADGPPREETRLDGRDWTSTLAVRRHGSLSRWDIVEVLLNIRTG